MIDVQKLAKEAGFANQYWPPSIAEPFERFAALVLEEAAKCCKEIQRRHDGRANKAIIARNQEEQIFFEGCMVGAEDCAEAIRSLKPKGEA